MGGVMGKPLNFMDQIRWLQAKNVAAAAIPAFGIARISSVDSSGILQLDYATESNQFVVVNGPAAIPASGYGAVTTDEICFAAYDFSTYGTPTAGQGWGAESGSFFLAREYGGFRILGAADTANEIVLVQRWHRRQCVTRTNVSGQVIANNSETAIAFGTADLIDTDSLHDTSTNNTRITVTAAGLYLVGASCQWAGNATGVRQLAIARGGATSTALVRASQVAGGTYSISQSVATVYWLTNGEYIEAYVYQDSGGNLNLQNTTIHSNNLWLANLG